MDAETKQVLEDMKSVVLDLEGKLTAHLQESQEPAPEAHSTDSETVHEQTPEAHSTDSGGDKPEIDETKYQALETECAALKEQVKELSSEAHLRQTLDGLLRGMTPEGYVNLGIKLGYGDLLAEGQVLEDPDKLHEVALEDVPGQPTILFSETLPAGEDGWEKSESLNMYVKVVNHA